MPDGATGRAFGSSKNGISSEKPDIVPECSDSAAKGQKCLRFVLDQGRNLQHISKLAPHADVPPPGDTKGSDQGLNRNDVRLTQ